MEWTFIVLMVMFLMYFAEGTYVTTLGKHLRDADVIDPDDLWFRRAVNTVKELHAILWGVCIMLPILIVSKWSVRAEVWTALFIAIIIHMYIDRRERDILPLETGKGYVVCLLMVIAVWLMWISYL